MEEELSALEQKLHQMLAMCSALRAENDELRAKLAGAEGEQRRLAEKLETARHRLESLVARLPT